MPFKNNPWWKIIALLIAIKIFFVLDGHIATLGNGWRWVALFPLQITQFLANTVGLPPDHAIIFSLVAGFPLTIVYWLWAVWALERTLESFSRIIR